MTLANDFWLSYSLRLRNEHGARRAVEIAVQISTTSSSIPDRRSRRCGEIGRSNAYDCVHEISSYVPDGCADSGVTDCDPDP